MIPETTTSHPPPLPLAAAASLAEARAHELRREAGVTEDRAKKALLLYEAGHLTETVLAEPAQAVQDYLASYNLDHRFRLPLYALLRMFERKRSFKNLSRLYEAELRSARSPTEKATALVDQASLAIISAGDQELVRACLERAIAEEPKAAAAELLEWNRLHAGDVDGALNALLRRAEATDDPIHRGVLLLEVAVYRERLGEVGAALEALKTAALGPTTHESFLVALARFARAHNFVPELVEATERRAELVGLELSEQQVEAEPDHALVERLRARAVALWYEAARLRCTSLSDAEGALACVSRALGIRPDDVLLRQTRMLAYDLMEDRQKAADEARTLLALGIEGEHAAALHFRLAEHALVMGNSEAARESLMEAIAQAGGSIAAASILDDLLLDEERHRDRVERRETRAATADAVRASRWLLEAAQIAAHDLKDADKARSLYQRAAAKQEGSLEVLREAYGAALELNDTELARFAIDRLLLRELDDDERAALFHHRVDVAESDDEARSLLAAHLDDVRLSAFVPELARLRAAEAHDYALLSRAHALLSERTLTADEQVAHLCAAARASLRGKDTTRARALLEQALTRLPGHRYAVALLEEVLRASGEGEQVVALLRKAAASQGDAREAELSLLLAGAAAEGSHDHAAAARSYEEAADRNPGSVGPMWALLRLAQRTGDVPLELSAREGLAQTEQKALGYGIEALLLADHYDLISDKPELAEHVLEGTLSESGVGLHAALALSLSRTAKQELREKAFSLLTQSAEPSQRGPFLRELGEAQFVRGEDRQRVLDAVEQVAALQGDDRFAALARASLPVGGAPREHAAALATFANNTSDAALAMALRGEALSASRLAGDGRGLHEDLLALGVSPDSAPDGELAEAVALHASPLEEPAYRARALHAMEGAAAASEQPARARLLARAELRGGDPAQAMMTLELRLSDEPDDLAALELMRVAARRAGNFERVATSAEALARCLEGDDTFVELWCELLEEAAAARMDMLDDAASAEALLSEVLAKRPGRAIAYGRLHDLLGERGDTDALIALVEGRTELVDEAEELSPLFYELARLYRAKGELDRALDALDHLSMLEEHVGGLALAVEIHTARENWSEAVEALEGLARAPGVPPAQRKLARLGAADFLQNRLKDGPGALAQLERLVAEGHGDAALHTRIADVALKLDRFDRAAEALLAAADVEKGDARVDLTLRAAEVVARSGDRARASSLYQRALDARPGHVAAVRALVALSSDEQAKNQALARFETEVRAEARSEPLSAEPLRKLLALSELRRSDDIALVALTSLVALGAANHGERDAADGAVRRVFGARPNPQAPLPLSELKDLFAPRVDDRYLALFRTLFGAAAEIDHLEPGRFGVGRGQRVSPREANQVRDEAAAMTSALGLPLGDFYVGGDEPTRVLAMPRDDQAAFVVGIGVTSPLSPTRRHQLATQVAGYALASLPLLTRTTAQATRLVYAALVAADAPLPAEAPRDELGELPRTLGKALPRKVKKALPELARALPDGGANVEAQARLMLRHTRRLALLLSGDLEAALESVVGAMPSPDVIGESDEALDLLRTWTSAPMALFRKRLGLAR